MNKEWSQLNKLMQVQIRHKETYARGIDSLLELRDKLTDTVMTFCDVLMREDFDAMPFANAKGYHNKTIGYSIWHISRIEDIVVHTLIKQDEQVFFMGDYQKRTNSPIITTGNELIKHHIADFSKQLDLKELYSYFLEVKESSEKIIKGLCYDELKKKISDGRKESLKALNVVSTKENAIWLIDYWCHKDIRGLIQMPLSRHWIMHIEAALRIKDKIQS